MDLTIPQALINELNVPQIVDIRAQLPVNKNYTWAQLAGVRPVNDLTTIVLHHDAIKKSLRNGWTDIDTAANIANTHINLKSNEPKGDAGFPYHIWIRSGIAYLCNNIEDRTYGVASNNGYTVHVCVHGEYYGTDQLTDADRRALIAVCVALKQTLPAYQAIKAHKELNPTDCPGYDYNGIRDDVVKVEAKIKAASDPSKTMENCYRAANQHLFLFNQYQANPSEYKWLESYLLKMHEITKEMGMYF